jgi:hypothetical protein
MSQYEQVVITMPAATRAELRRRLDTRYPKGRPGNNSSGVITESLNRYYEMLRRGRHALRAREYAGAELGLILEVARSYHFDAGGVNVLPALIANEPKETFARWGVFVDLCDRLTALTYAERCALVDAIERWWINQMGGAAADYGKLLDEPEQVTP